MGTIVLLQMICWMNLAIAILDKNEKMKSLILKTLLSTSIIFSQNPALSPFDCSSFRIAIENSTQGSVLVWRYKIVNLVLCKRKFDISRNV